MPDVADDVQWEYIQGLRTRTDAGNVVLHRLYKDPQTGIRKETKTETDNPLGRPKDGDTEVVFYHPDESEDAMHDTFEDALKHIN